VEDLTDNEAEEKLRRFWSENWLWIVGGIVLGMALLWGWQFWQRSRMEQAQQDVAAYQSVISALGGGKFDEAVVAAKALRDRRPASPYADQADLALAAAAVQERRFDEAASHLKAVADGAKDVQLRAVARSRLARILVEQSKYDDALALLGTEDAGSFAALDHDVRGDAYAGKGDAAAARREYDAALDAQNAEAGVDRDFIELKRDALPPAASSGTGAATDTAAAAPVAAATTEAQPK
jgi:predicted negative regulator of RcsB-dependent stress response